VCNKLLVRRWNFVYTGREIWKARKRYMKVTFTLMKMMMMMMMMIHSLGGLMGTVGSILFFVPSLRSCWVEEVHSLFMYLL
jgi:hypothetical protein